MKSIFMIYQDLLKQSSLTSDIFNVSSLPLVKNHKIGVSKTNQPMFFIRCNDNEKANSLDISLEFISVQFNRYSQLISKDKNVIDGVYTIISLKAELLDMQEYFIEVVFLIIKNLSAIPKYKELKVEIEKITNLFNKFSDPPTKTIQGLWAELFVIERSSNPEYLIQSWHNTPIDKFDFNDGIDKIEVKSTTKNRRVHKFSIEQLNPNLNSKLIIASVFAIEIGIGKSIYDLLESIKRKLKDENIILRVNEIIARTLGKDIDKSFELFFDYQQAFDTLKFYKCADIPSIDLRFVAKGVLNIQFDSDLTDVKSISKLTTKSLLHESIL